MMPTPLIAPSLLSADFTRLGEQLDDLLEHEVEWIHCDVMDGHFVPNISFGPMIAAAARSVWTKTMDVHLMTYHPEQYLPAIKAAKAQYVTVHQEACIHLHRSLQMIKDAGMLAGVALNPATAIDSLEWVWDSIDLVTLMSVNPGFGGQSLISSTYSKITALAQRREQLGLSFLIQVDGGVNDHNIQDLVRAGADVLVAGNTVFKADQPGQQAQTLQHLANRAHTLIA